MSKDTGATWTTFNTGLPEAVMIFDLVFSPANHSLLAFTHGHGVYTYSLENQHTTSIENKPAGTEDWSLFPNPASGSVYLDFHQPVTLKSPVEIYNLKGELVYYQTVTESNSLIKIDLNGLKPGVYFVKTIINGYERMKKIFIGR
jgi:hypothetical protein